MTLTEDEVEVLLIGRFSGPRPGSNEWALVDLEGVAGEIVDGLIRRGLIAGEERKEIAVLTCTSGDIADHDIDCTHDYDLTSAGEVAIETGRAALEKKP